MTTVYLGNNQSCLTLKIQKYQEVVRIKMAEYITTRKRWNPNKRYENIGLKDCCHIYFMYVKL